MEPLYNSCWGRKNGTDVVENSMAVPPLPKLKIQ